MQSIIEHLSNPNGKLGQVIGVVSEKGKTNFDHWAKLTADRIVALPPIPNIEADKVKNLVAETLVPHFKNCLKEEQTGLQENAFHLNTSYNVMKYVESAIKDLQGLPEHKWSNDMKHDQWVNFAKSEIGSMIATVVNIERLEFVDDNPDNLSAKNYKLKMNGSI